jgi:hypothetical protein
VYRYEISALLCKGWDVLMSVACTTSARPAHLGMGVIDSSAKPGRHVGLKYVPIDVAICRPAEDGPAKNGRVLLKQALLHRPRNALQASPGLPLGTEVRTQSLTYPKEHDKRNTAHESGVHMLVMRTWVLKFNG